MISRKPYFFAAPLIFCCLTYCAASNTPDLSDIAVDVISHLEPALRLLLSAEELVGWNESVTEQHPMCIDSEVKELFTSNTQSECVASLEELFEHEPVATSGDSDDLDAGSGSDDDAETFSISALSKVFCNQACGSLLFSAYSTCGLFDGTVGKQLNDILCRKTSKDELCLEVLAGPSFPTVLTNCTTEKGCGDSCKEGLEQVSHDFGYCSHCLHIDNVVCK